MRLVFEGPEKDVLRAQAAEAEKAGEDLLAASLREMADQGVDLSRTWEKDRVQIFAERGIDVIGEGEQRVA
ncbi:hypothetical protein [Streptomyces sp. NPDC048527]|uniref:hypothetical protein n=1 Tax=Streptomyces sp. NPDC048527 TaxID=3365568 RepID=UPI003713E1A3